MLRFIRFLLLWGAVIFGIPLVLVAVGASADIAGWVGMGLLFGAMAHISQSPYGKYLRNLELNPFSRRVGQSSEPYPPEAPLLTNRKLPSLDAPIKRAAFLVLLVGLAVCAVTFLVYEISEYIGFLDAMFNRPYSFWGYKIAILIGAALAIVGYVCAFHYEQTVGALGGFNLEVQHDATTA
jgi:hypothetical protein